MSQPLLEVKDLRVSYHTYAGEVQAVRGLSFSMERGETLAVVGESGCGKSVSAKALMGLINCPPGELKPGSQVLFEGKNVMDFTPAEWSAFRGRECAMIFQDALAALNPTVTVGRQIAENLTVHHMAPAGPRPWPVRWRCSPWWVSPSLRSGPGSTPTSSPAVCASGP